MAGEGEPKMHVHVWRGNSLRGAQENALTAEVIDDV